MAIQVKKPKRKLASEINVVPMIDVMLVLLIVFMVAAPMMMQGVKIELPEANSAPVDEPDEFPWIYTVKADGTYYAEQGDNARAKVMTLAAIKEEAAKILRQNPKKQVFVRGDTRTEYGAVVLLMSELQSAGATSVGLVTEPPTGKK